MTTANRRILVVDDEHDIREVAQITLEMVGGWEVITARSGAECLEKASANRVDAILLDVMMPDMDGPTTFQKLRAREETRAIPVVLLTAKVQASDRKRFTDLGVEGCISKPFDPMTLSEQIAGLLHWTP